MEKGELNIVFMGTPEFAVPSLEALVQSGYNVVGVVTAPDREAGRGRKVRFSPVKEFALRKNIKILQPEKLRNEDFLADLKALNAHLQVIVAFRMLPEQVWKMPALGSFNLHASLLPQYRGAAPINHAIMNGEKVTGLTTFFLDEKIDTGRIIKQVKMHIGEEENFGQLHDRMMNEGATLIIDTVEKIRIGKVETISQDELPDNQLPLKPAPKIFKEDCAIEWSKPVTDIHNQVRGLSPYPGAFSYLNLSDGKKIMFKILKSIAVPDSETTEPGRILCDRKETLKIAAADGLLKVLELQMEGKRKMTVKAFLSGYSFNNSAFFGK
jgi:methionyl-tRNA formyltransferase